MTIRWKRLVVGMGLVLISVIALLSIIKSIEEGNITEKYALSGRFMWTGGLAVIDLSDLKQNIAQAMNDVTKITNQVNQINNQAQMLENIDSSQFDSLMNTGTPAEHCETK